LNAPKGAPTVVGANGWSNFIFVKVGPALENDRRVRASYGLFHLNGLDRGNGAFVNQLTHRMRIVGAPSEDDHVNVMRLQQPYQFYARAKVEMDSPADMRVEPRILRESLVHSDVLRFVSSKTFGAPRIGNRSHYFLMLLALRATHKSATLVQAVIGTYIVKGKTSYRSALCRRIDDLDHSFSHCDRGKSRDRHSGRYCEHAQADTPDIGTD
jgi:hypothetical protein